MKLQLPLLALLAADRMGDSEGDAGRAALLAMCIRPPMMGLLVALAVAKPKKAPRSRRATTDPEVRLLVDALGAGDPRRVVRLATAVDRLQRAMDEVSSELNVVVNRARPKSTSNRKGRARR